MTNSGLKMVHIIYDDATTFGDRKAFVERLRSEVRGLPAFLISLLRAGRRIVPLSSTRDLEARLSSNPNLERVVHLAEAFEQVVKDYKQPQSQPISDRYILLLLGSVPIDGWQQIRNELALTYKARMMVCWVSKERTSDQDNQVLLQTFLSDLARDPLTNEQSRKILKLDANLINTLMMTLKELIGKDTGKSNPLARSTYQAVPTPVTPGLAAPRAPTEAPVVPPAPAQIHPSSPSATVVEPSLPGERGTSGQASAAPIATPQVREGAHSLPPSTSGDWPKVAEESPPLDETPRQSQPQSTDGKESTQMTSERNSEGTTQPESHTQQSSTSIPSPAAQPQASAQWRVLEPPAELSPRPSHERSDFCEGSSGWYTVAASRRGKLHAHEATFREDEFNIAFEGGCVLVAVADGAGSHHLSRVGSKLAVDTAVAVMTAGFSKDKPSERIAKSVLEEALVEAQKALYKEAEERGCNVKDFSTTLLLLAYYPARNLVAVAQVGDGLLVAQQENGTVLLLGEPESGEYSGQTFFLTSYKPAEFGQKVYTKTFDAPFRLFLVMTDGVADDIYPPAERLLGLIKPLPGLLGGKSQQEQREGLSQLIGYDRPGSFDDRTLAVIYHEKFLAGQTAPPPAPSSSTSQTVQQGTAASTTLPPMPPSAPEQGAAAGSRTAVSDEPSTAQAEVTGDHPPAPVQPPTRETSQTTSKDTPTSVGPPTRENTGGGGNTASIVIQAEAIGNHAPPGGSPPAEAEGRAIPPTDPSSPPTKPNEPTTPEAAGDV